MILHGVNIHIVYVNGHAEDAVFSRVEWGFLFILGSDGKEVGIPLDTIKNVVEKGN
jgi:hypothetical protein